MDNQLKEIIEYENISHQMMMQYYESLAEEKRKDTERWAMAGFMGTALALAIATFFLLAIVFR